MTLIDCCNWDFLLRGLLYRRFKMSALNKKLIVLGKEWEGILVETVIFPACLLIVFVIKMLGEIFRSIYNGKGTPYCS